MASKTHMFICDSSTTIYACSAAAVDRVVSESEVPASRLHLPRERVVKPAQACCGAVHGLRHALSRERLEVRDVHA